MGLPAAVTLASSPARTRLTVVAVALTVPLLASEASAGVPVSTAPVSVLAHGAVANDAGNDTQAFQSALAAAAAPSSATRIVVVPPGAYSILPDSVTVPAGVTLRGPGAVLSARNYGFSMLGMLSGTTVERVAVDGRDRVVRGITVAAGSRTVTIVGAKVSNVASPVDSSVAGYEQNRSQTVAGIRVEGNTDNVLIDGARVENVRAAVPVDPALRDVGDYEGPTPLAGWGHEHPTVVGAEGTTRVWASHSWAVGTAGHPTRAGQRSVRSELRTTDDPVNGGLRSEMSRRPEPSAITDDRWYGFSVYLPRGGADDFKADPSPEVVGQWHNTPDIDPATGQEENVSPPLALQTRNGVWEVVHLWDDDRISSNGKINRAGKVTRRTVGSYASDKGTWVDWAFRVRWDYRTDAAGGDGRLEAYKNGKLVHAYDGPIGTNDATAGPYFKWGLYKWDWNPGPTPAVPSRTTRRVVYHDEYRAAGPAGSLALVSPPRYPESAALRRQADGGEPIAARGILLSAGPGQAVPRNVTVRNSTVSNVGPSDDGDGLVVQGAADSLPGDANLTVVGNTFTRVGKRAVKVQWPGVTVSRNKIASSFNGDNGHRVRPAEALRHDLFSFVGVLASRVTVTGNTTSGPGSVYAGVEVAAESDVTISGNTFANPAPAKGAGSSLVRVSRPVERLVVSGNSFRNAEHGVRCDVGLNGPTFSGNRLTAVTQPGSGCLSQVARIESPGPLAVRGGTVVLVRGSGFGADLAAFRRSGFTATLNGRPVPLAWVDDTTLRGTAPSGAANAAAVFRLLRGGVTVGTAPAGSYAAS
jgi:hypothetical protein